MENALDSAGWALKLVELLLVFGGVIAFGVWQLRDVERARRESQRRRDPQGTDEPTGPQQGPR